MDGTAVSRSTIYRPFFLNAFIRSAAFQENVIYFLAQRTMYLPFVKLFNRIGGLDAIGPSRLFSADATIGIPKLD